MSIVILADRGDEQKIIIEEKEKWVNQVLLAIGIEETVLNNLPREEVVEYLNSQYIEVIDNLGEESIDIFKNSKKIASWSSPKIILRKENNKYFYEIHLKEWALPFQMLRKGEK